jgi:hypothetical protein
MEVSGQLDAPADLSPGKRSAGTSLDRMLGGLQDRSGCGGEGNNFALPGIWTQDIQAEDGRYTDWAILTSIIHFNPFFIYMLTSTAIVQLQGQNEYKQQRL